MYLNLWAFFENASQWLSCNCKSVFSLFFFLEAPKLMSFHGIYNDK